MSNNVETKKSKMTGKKIGLLCVILAVIICVVFFVFLGKDGTKDGLDEIYPADTESMITETEFTELEYPQIWEDSVRVEVKEGDFSTAINYYGTVGKHKEQLLFTVYFGGKGEIPIGVYTEDGVSTDVCITYGELDVEGWSEEDQNTIYTMQEDVNFVIMKLENDRNFEKVS